MSLLNKASLIQIPSGYKDGTLYSAKPTNGDGDFTFSRGSNLAATRVNSEGLIEKGRENLCFASDTSNWSVGRATRGSSTTIKGVSGYFYSDSTGNPNINKSVAGYSTGFATFSIYIDTTNANSIELRFAKDGNASNGTQATFNATTKTLGSIIENLSYVSSGSTQLNYEDLGDNVFRLSIGANFTASGTSHFPVVYFGTGNSNVAIGGGQVERSLVATDLLVTTASTAQAGILEDMPRLDYSGGASCPSLLLEPQRSNNVTQSEAITTSDWSYINTTATINTNVSPEGVENASTIDTGTDTAVHYAQAQLFTFTSGNDYTMSVFVKKDNTALVQLIGSSGIFNGNFFATYNLDTLEVTEGTNATASMEDFGNGWYRLILTGTATSTGSARAFYICFTNDKSTRLPSFTASNERVYVYGAQMEEGSYPTSYIPTYGAGASVTRGADDCTNADVSSLLGSGVGTAFIDMVVNGADTQGNIPLTIGTGTSNLVYLWVKTNLNLVYEAYTGGGLQAAISTSTGFYTYGDRIKVALVWADNDFAMYINGTLIGTDTSGTAPTPTKLWLGEYTAGNYKGASINEVLLFPTRLSNDELATLTTL